MLNDHMEHLNIVAWNCAKMQQKTERRLPFLEKRATAMRKKSSFYLRRNLRLGAFLSRLR